MGLAGPAGISQAGFDGHAGTDIGAGFELIQQRAIPAGSYVLIATVSIGSHYQFDGNPQENTAQCELRDGSGNFIAGSGARGASHIGIVWRAALTLVGGVFVPDGQIKTIQTWCRVLPDGGRYDAVTVLFLKIGGFGI
jgi:hypothetical protein